MSPTSLLNVSPDLMREHARHRAPGADWADAEDPTWIVGVCLVLTLFVTLLVVGVH